tara:strand:- start:420 stop:647 length:228 start_codon:yes stop_codon:yes gene_type:complete
LEQLPKLTGSLKKERKKNKKKRKEKKKKRRKKKGNPIKTDNEGSNKNIHSTCKQQRSSLLMSGSSSAMLGPLRLA